MVLISLGILPTWLSKLFLAHTLWMRRLNISASNQASDVAKTFVTSMTFFAIVCSLSSGSIWMGSSSSSVLSFRKRDQRLKPAEATAQILPRLHPSFRHPIPKEIYSTWIVVWFSLHLPCLHESSGDAYWACKPFSAPKLKLQLKSLKKLRVKQPDS